MNITERFHQLRGAVHITRARTGKDSSMVVWGANVADLTALLDIAEAVPSSKDLERLATQLDVADALERVEADDDDSDVGFIEYLNRQLTLRSAIVELAKIIRTLEEAA